jgi:MFS transporter, UMF1 family
MATAPALQATSARRPLTAWILYDMAGHGYSLMIPGVAFPVYFAAHVVGGRGNADVLWSIALGLPLLLAGITGPWIGALADATGRRRLLLAAATIAGSVATALLAWVGAGDVMLGIVLFTFAHFAHLIAISLYNSYLPLIATPARFARVSGLAWGLSYVGSIVCFLLCLPFTRDGLAVENIGRYTGAFIMTAAFLAVVGLSAVMALPRQAGVAAPSGNPGPYQRVASTLRSWRRDRNVPTLLLAYYLVNDGVVTAIFFTALMFRHTFGMDVQEILLLSLLLQLVAIPSTMIFGWLGERWSQRGGIYLALGLWLVVLAVMATAEGPGGALAIAPALGLVVGSTQTLFRSLYAQMVPVHRASEYFGFHTLVGRASAALGPLAFGAVSMATGSQRIAMSSLAVFFIAGGVVLAFVRVPKPAQAWEGSA